MREYRRAVQENLMDPECALKLLKLWVWIPEDILQASFTCEGKRYKLKEMSTSRFKYRRDFWEPLVAKFNTGSQAGNHEMVRDILRNTFLRNLPDCNGVMRQGLWIDTLFYRKNKDLSFEFYQTLQSRKIEKVKMSWKWHSVFIAEQKVKILELTAKNIAEVEGDPVDHYVPEVLESDSGTGEIVDLMSGISDPF